MQKTLEWYLHKAADAAREQPQKATTHGKSWYGLFAGFRAAKYGLASFDETDAVFRDIMPRMFDFEKGEPLVIPQRIQNTSSAISLLVDRYEADPEDRMISCSALQIAYFATFLPSEKRNRYVTAAEVMLGKHTCLEQKLIPDCRMRGCSLRY